MRQLFVKILTSEYLKKIEEIEEYIELHNDAKNTLVKKIKLWTTKKIENPEEEIQKSKESWREFVKENESLQRLSRVMSYRETEINSFAKRVNHLVEEIDQERKKINEIAFVFDAVYSGINNEQSKRQFLRIVNDKENLKEYVIQMHVSLRRRYMEERYARM